jgi:hypothetical protein
MLGCGLFKDLCVAVSCCVFAAAMLPEPLIAGNNRSASVRLSWQPDANRPSLTGVPPGQDTLLLYCRVEDAREMRSLGVVLRWDPGDSPGCMQLISTPERVNCGRVV